MKENEHLPPDFTKENTNARGVKVTLDPYAEKDDSFSKIRQGSITNTLTKMRITEENAQINLITDIATVATDKLSLSLLDFSKLASGLKTTTHKLFDAITSVFTESGANSPTVQLPLDTYMAMCGLKDKKEARNQVKMDINTLLNLRFSYSASNKWDSDFMEVMLCARGGIVRGVITMEFTRPVYDTIKHYAYMPYPRQLWSLNPQYNPNSYYFLRKISEHKHMNRGKSNEDILSVRTLLSASPLLPKYEEISKGGQVEQRIIRPFERDMNALSSTVLWAYFHEGGDCLTSDETENLSYNTFSRLMLHIKWVAYPVLDLSDELEEADGLVENSSM